MKKDNSPNASRLIEALRSTGYDNISALADIVDNSFDAKAKNIYIDFIPEGEYIKIIIADDGAGMDEKTLDQAMRLGSETKRDIKTDLGKFGMGLVTASLSIGRKLKVITKQESIFLTAIQDVDEIKLSNKFEKELRKSTDEEETEFTSFFDRKRIKNGTVVIIEKTDLMQNNNVDEFSKKVIKELGQIFRYYIKKDAKINVLGKPIQIVDPLMLNNKKTKLYSDENFEVNSGSAIKEKIRIRIALLPKYGQHESMKKEINFSNQGFYILRNNREVKHGATLDVFKKHNDYNRVRIELFFKSELDKSMGITFSKRDIKPNQIILDNISEIVTPQLNSIKRRLKKERVASKSKDIDHDRATQEIASKSKSLILPKFKLERRKKGTTKGTIKPKGTKHMRKPQQTTKEVLSSKHNCIIYERSMGSAGEVFDVEQVGKTIYIYYNIDHPFYEEIFLNNRQNKKLIDSINFLFYSIATAKLKVSNEENEDIFQNFHAILSSNLRVLINK